MSVRVKLPQLALLALLASACQDVLPADDRPRLDRIEIVRGDGQSAVEDHFLADSIVAEALVEGGARYVGTIFVRIDSGNGRIEVSRSQGEGDGVQLSGPPNAGTIAVRWAVGPASEEQRLSLYAVRAFGDTLWVNVSATATPAG